MWVSKWVSECVCVLLLGFLPYMMSWMDTTSLLHAWLVHNMSGHCHLEIEIPMYLLHKLLCIGGEKRQISDNQEKWDMQYTMLSYMGSTLHHLCESIVGCNNSILVVIYGYISKSCSSLPIITINPFESSLLWTPQLLKEDREGVEIVCIFLCTDFYFFWGRSVELCFEMGLLVLVMLLGMVASWDIFVWGLSKVWLVRNVVPIRCNKIPHISFHHNFLCSLVRLSFMMCNGMSIYLFMVY
jgi:hypothetical protein